MADKLHSVKVCVKSEDDEWKNVGTGHISFKYIEQLQGVCLLVHSESDGSLIMKFKISHNISYQKPKNNVIILSEPVNHSVSIHFENPDVCQKIGEDICQIQGKGPSVKNREDFVYAFETFEQMPEMCNEVEMPKCQRNELVNIENLISLVYVTPRHQEKLAMILENEDYIKKLLRLFHICENKHDTEGLHYLYKIIKGILFLDKISLFKIMFSDECILDVVGCLEYDPESIEPKQHRKFLTQTVKFKDVMPIKNFELIQKIHQTYRIEYIYDILMPTPYIFKKLFFLI